MILDRRAREKFSFCLGGIQIYDLSLSRQKLFQLSYEEAWIFHCIFIYILEDRDSVISLGQDEDSSRVTTVSKYLLGSYPTKIIKRKTMLKKGDFVTRFRLFKIILFGKKFSLPL